MYLIAGIVAIGAALYFMTLDTSIFDWFILGMGIVSIFKGVQEYRQVKGGVAAPQKDDGEAGPDAPDDKA
jgi:hypothetical protein